MALQTIAVTVKSPSFDVEVAFVNAIRNGTIHTWSYKSGTFFHTTGSQTAKASVTRGSKGLTQLFTVGGAGLNWSDVGFVEGRFIEMLVSHFSQQILKVEIY